MKSTNTKYQNYEQLGGWLIIIGLIYGFYFLSLISNIIDLLKESIDIRLIVIIVLSLILLCLIVYILFLMSRRPKNALFEIRKILKIIVLFCVTSMVFIIASHSLETVISAQRNMELLVTLMIFQMIAEIYFKRSNRVMIYFEMIDIYQDDVSSFL